MTIAGVLIISYDFVRSVPYCVYLFGFAIKGLLPIDNVVADAGNCSWIASVGDDVGCSGSSKDEGVACFLIITYEVV